MDELDFYDDDDYGLELAEFAPKRRRRKRKNPEPAIAIATPLLLLVAGYLGWCAYAQTKTGRWTFTPWKTTPIAHRLPLGRPLRQNYSSFDAAVEKMMAPSPSVVEQDLWRRPTHYDSEREVVSFIEP